MFVEGVPTEAAEGPTADYYDSQRRAWGFLPNYAQAFAHRPDVAAAWVALGTAVRGHMDRRRFELATIAAARARRSTYCTVAHSSFLRDVCGDQATIDALADDPSGGKLDEQDRAVVALATKVATDAASVQQEDVDRARAAGLTDEDVVDVVMAAAARLFFTAVLDGLGTQVDLQTAQTFEPGQLAQLVVGRPVAVEPSAP